MKNEEYKKIIIKTGLTTGQIEKQSGVNRSIIWRLKKDIPTNLTNTTRRKMNNWIKENNLLPKKSLLERMKYFFQKG